MPKRVTPRRKRTTAPPPHSAKGRSSAQREPPPPKATVGVPHMPAMYLGKNRDTFLAWSHAEQRLVKSRNYWICTTRPDGRPHSAPVWGFWHDGSLYFGTHRD